MRSANADATRDARRSQAASPVSRASRSKSIIAAELPEGCAPSNASTGRAGRRLAARLA